MAEVGKAVAVALAGLNMTIADAARETGIERTRLSKVINARDKHYKRLPWEDTLKLAELLGLSLNDLGYEQPPENVVWQD